eukprot:6936-Heterococcus_DN1.PRE.5
MTDSLTTEHCDVLWVDERQTRMQKPYTTLTQTHALILMHTYGTPHAVCTSSHQHGGMTLTFLITVYKADVRVLYAKSATDANCYIQLLMLIVGASGIQHESVSDAAFNQLMMSECIVYCNTLCYCMHSTAADHATA